MASAVGITCDIDLRSTSNGIQRGGKSYTSFSVGDGFSRFGDPDRGVRTDREQFLLALELVPETPLLAASGSDVDVQSGAVGELVGLVHSLGFADLRIGQHRRPQHTRSGRYRTRFRTRIFLGMGGYRRDWIGRILTRKPLRCKHFGAVWERPETLVAERVSANLKGFFLDLHIVSAVQRQRSRSITPVATADWSEYGRTIVANS
jgi:hypothetical protein